ncbi:MAG: hypothetical protein FWJ70_09715 [Micromonosporaceae bacterium]|jgi:hypothetical protein
MDQTTSRAEPVSPAVAATAQPAAAPPSAVVVVRPSGSTLARHAMWTLPAYALGRMWLSLVAEPDPAGDPQAWAARVTGDAYQRAQLLVGLAGELLVLVAVVALAALVSGRGRVLASAGLLAGLAAAVLALPRWTATGVVAPVLGEAVSGRELDAAEWYGEILARTDPAAAVAGGLLGLAFVLLGTAGWRSRALGRAEGLLLVVAGPLLAAAAWYEPMLTPLGALPLLAAGLAIAWSAGRPRWP